MTCLALRHPECKQIATSRGTPTIGYITSREGRPGVTAATRPQARAGEAHPGQGRSAGRRVGSPVSRQACGPGAGRAGGRQGRGGGRAGGPAGPGAECRGAGGREPGSTGASGPGGMAGDRGGVDQSRPARRAHGPARRPSCSPVMPPLPETRLPEAGRPRVARVDLGWKAQSAPAPFRRGHRAAVIAHPGRNDRRHAAQAPNSARIRFLTHMRTLYRRKNRPHSIVGMTLLRSRGGGVRAVKGRGNREREHIGVCRMIGRATCGPAHCVRARAPQCRQSVAVNADLMPTRTAGCRRGPLGVARGRDTSKRQGLEVSRRSRGLPRSGRVTLGEDLESFRLPYGTEIQPGPAGNVATTKGTVLR